MEVGGIRCQTWLGLLPYIKTDHRFAGLIPKVYILLYVDHVFLQFLFFLSTV